MNVSKIVVTGGAGFIGSHLTRRLAGMGHRVTVLDDLSSGKRENLRGQPTGDDIELVEGSVLDADLVQQLFRGTDFVFHLAAMVSVPKSIANPRKSHETNVDGTFNVLLAARDSAVKKVVYASSAAVYGDSPEPVQHESAILRPQSPYAVHKIIGEQYGAVFSRVFDLATAGLRYFNVFGPRQSPDSQYAAAIPGMIREVLAERPPIIYGDGRQTRDFVYVDDVVSATILAMGDTLTGVCNVGLGKGVTIKHLAEMIAHLAGSPKQPIYQKPRPGDVLHSVAGIDRLTEAGFSPRFSLEDGLRETLAVFHDEAQR